MVEYMYMYIQDDLLLKSQDNIHDVGNMLFMVPRSNKIVVNCTSFGASV